MILISLLPTPKDFKQVLLLPVWVIRPAQLKVQLLLCLGSFSCWSFSWLETRLCLNQSQCWRTEWMFSDLNIANCSGRDNQKSWSCGKQKLKPWSIISVFSDDLDEFIWCRWGWSTWLFVSCYSSHVKPHLKLNSNWSCKSLSLVGSLTEYAKLFKVYLHQCCK